MGGIISGKTGVTLVELLVALAILSIVVLGLAFYQSSTQRDATGHSAQLNRGNFANELQFALSSNQFCTQNLLNINMGPLAPGNQPNLTFNAVTCNAQQVCAANGPVLYSTGTFPNSITYITGLVAKNNTIMTPTQRIIDIVANLQNAKPDANGNPMGLDMYGSQYYSVTTSVAVVTDINGVIQQCVGPINSNVDLNLMNTICQYNGRHLVYDPVTQSCVDPGSNCVNGDNTSATCPANSHVVKCNAAGPDTPSASSTLVRNYTNGAGSKNNAPPGFISNNTTTTCSCFYATDNNAAAWTCQACCIAN